MIIITVITSNDSIYYIKRLYFESPKNRLGNVAKLHIKYSILYSIIYNAFKCATYLYTQVLVIYRNLII